MTAVVHLRLRHDRNNHTQFFHITHDLYPQHSVCLAKYRYRGGGGVYIYLHLQYASKRVTSRLYLRPADALFSVIK